MSEQDHLRKTLEHYRKLRQQKLDEIKPILEAVKPIEAMIRQLEQDLNEPSTLEHVEIEAPVVIRENTPPAGRGPLNIRPDEFFMMTQTEAAKKYLKMVGKAVTLDELAAALQKGGATLGGADPKKTLYVSLARNPKKEFVWPSKDHIALPEFYQDRK